MLVRNIGLQCRFTSAAARLRALEHRYGPSIRTNSTFMPARFTLKIVCIGYRQTSNNPKMPRRVVEELIMGLPHTPKHSKARNYETAQKKAGGRQTIAWRAHVGFSTGSFRSHSRGCADSRLTRFVDATFPPWASKQCLSRRSIRRRGMSTNVITFVTSASVTAHVLKQTCLRNVVEGSRLL